MRQLTYVKKNLLEWWEIPEPELQSATDAIVRPLAAARCDGDKIFLFHDVTTLMRIGTALHYLDPVTTEGLGSRPYQAPIAVGHECVGEVISCGDDVTGVRPGELVVVPWAISCGACTSGRSTRACDTPVRNVTRASRRPDPECSGGSPVSSTSSAAMSWQRHCRAASGR